MTGTPLEVDDRPTAPIDEARAALIALIADDPAKAADIIITCRDLVLSFDDRLHAAEKTIDGLRERLVGVELLQLRDGLQTGRPA